MTHPDVIIVGAGFAGLSAAAMLAEAGRRVLVLDARPQLGGRATAFRDRVTGELVDNGQHVLFGCYHDTFAFFRRIGAAGNFSVQPSMAVPYLDQEGRSSALRCPRLPAPLHLLAGVLSWGALPWRDRLSVLRMARPIVSARRALARDANAQLVSDEVTVSAWLERAGQSRRLREWLWDPLAVAALNQSPDEAAAAPFVRVLAALFGPDAADSALVLPLRPLNLAYAEPARDYLTQRGGEVRSNTVARLVVEDGEGINVEIRGEPQPDAVVIAAVPWFGLATLFGGTAPPALEGIVRNATAMGSKPIVTVNLWYDARVMEDALVGLPGRATQWVFDKQALLRKEGSVPGAGVDASHLSLVTSSAEAMVGESDQEIVAAAAREMCEALPRARQATLLRGTVIREKRATFSLAPGQPLRPGTRTPLRGFYLAGDWTDTGLPGTIESAVVSGHRAAQAVLDDHPRA